MYDLPVFQGSLVNAVQKKGMQIREDVSCHKNCFFDHIPDVSVVDNEDRHQRSDMQHDIKQHASVRLNVENILNDSKMPGTADRKKLRYALHHSEQN
jgi:hypothetical protein